MEVLFALGKPEWAAIGTEGNERDGLSSSDGYVDYARLDRRSRLSKLLVRYGKGVKRVNEKTSRPRALS